MDFSKFDADYFARLLAYTQQIHRDVYPSVDPNSPSLSQKGKVILITGGGSGIGGRGFAPAFAQAGARAIVLVGRRQTMLDEVAESIRKMYPIVAVLTISSSVTDKQSVDCLFAAVKSKIGTVDVLINNAGIQHKAEAIMSSDPDNWWNTFDVNLRGSYLMTRCFLKQLGSELQGTVINISSGAANVVRPGKSAYGISKLAIMRFTEYVAAEAENVTAVALDPGTVDTAMQDIMPGGFRKFARDTPELAGGVAVWLSTEQASFLNGRSIVSNWVIDEMVARQDEIAASQDLKVVMQGKFGIDS